MKTKYQEVLVVILLLCGVYSCGCDKTDVVECCFDIEQVMWWDDHYEN